MATTAVTMMMNMKMLTTMMMTQMLAMMMMILMLMLMLMMVMTAMVVMMVMAVMLEMMVFSEVAARIPWSLKSHPSLRNRGTPETRNRGVPEVNYPGQNGAMHHLSCKLPSHFGGRRHSSGVTRSSMLSSASLPDCDT